MKDLSKEWKVNTPQFLKEIIQHNPSVNTMRIPMKIFGDILYEVAERAGQLNDDRLNSLMARLALYEICDPYSKEYNPKVTKQLIAKGNKP